MTLFLENFNDTVQKVYDNDFPLLMPKWGYVASAFILFLIGFFGFFLNLMVILLMIKDRQLWTPLNIILFNLVCSDFSVSVLGNPLTLVSALFHRWIFGRTMCVLYGFFMALLGITSITTLTVISFERYLMVTRPLSNRHLTSKGAALSIVFIWMYSLALTAPPLIGWGNYVNEAANISCSVNWHEQSMNTLTYILFLFAMGQIVPFVVITYSYVNIIRTMKRNSQRLGRVSRAESRATTMVFIMIVAFTVAWTPYSAFALIEQFATDGIISPGTGVIPALVAKSSICYNPLIYVGMNTQFRKSIKRVFGIHSTRRHSQTGKGVVSPAYKLSGTNDFTIRFNSSDNVSSTTLKRPKDKMIKFNDDTPTADVAETNRNYGRNTELCTIQENKTVSGAERSSETVYDEESSNSHKKDYVFSESCKVIREQSHELTIEDSERLVFNKTDLFNQGNDDNKDVLMNVYGNQAFEDYVTDVTNNVNHNQSYKKPMITSYSLDFSNILKENKRRQLSIETKLETFIQPQTVLKETVIRKFFDQTSKQGQDCFRSYLYESDKKVSDINL